ncbi:MAG: pyroglutamyl-peptidase I [Candidatus Dactylopiibacterium carminicum]|uniref:pyroglutamyl-peptidase I n=1 Tax=Candidatus Dactylopiibacterium carminicum TaxID=857335 RepID=UPI000BCF8632|nr:pyroglutamyl-peptidase I [Candidatus Dactylopiibacterium carminicum]PAT00519.1 MAG: pyroglutamyl-peptidase I [Candidatus Dactylopiibacterium carminicum]
MPDHGGILLTGFEPFGQAVENPSAHIAQAFDGTQVAGLSVQGRLLPCVFGEARRHLAAHIADCSPSIILCLGLAAKRPVISIERVALNFIDAPIPDNTGKQPMEAPVIAGGPSALFARLPLRSLLARLQQAGLPAEISLSAGSYVCNELFYGLLHSLSQQPADIQAGFIHVPPMPGQIPENPGLALEAQIFAIRLVLECLTGSCAPPAGLTGASGRCD